ncbi:MAG: Nicotinamide-nucleotide amidohydrolase PncC [Alphaproteobacteria bacterium MarineAlpha6_Bin4]|nr:MAG: Nicotinamide-nucleotide amidohydrolase PncC [Alphaproteobacteria bacterium MarineAlpha6_Bin4]|tara:strand:- start:235 stop:717 length:483 start_codon:yes stop_codon:yes gene_type:complete
MFPIKIKNKAEKVVKLCLKKRIKLAFAESCTGGLLSSLITSFPNSSKIFIGGFITYSNLSKQNMIGVKSKTLKKYGAVSQEVAKEMVKGVWKKDKLNIALSITGIAGPTGQTKKKRVGLIYIGLKSKKGTIVNEFNFKGNRQKIRYASVEKAIDLISSII